MDTPITKGRKENFYGKIFLTTHTHRHKETNFHSRNAYLDSKTEIKSFAFPSTP